MIKRTKKGQIKHDEGVFKSATWYKNRGFKTFADLPGWEKPKSIGGFIPDLIARKGKREIVVEIETKNTANIDMEQQEAFENYTKKSNNKTFRKKTV